MTDIIISYITLAVKTSIPLLLGTTGEIISEKVGNLNLGVEGMMLMGAFAGFYTSFYTGNLFLGLLAAAFLGGFGALIYAFLTVTLRANQVVTGLTLSIFGAGFTSFAGNSLAGSNFLSIVNIVPKYFLEIHIPVLSDIPIIGRLFFKYGILVYFSIILAILVHFYLNKTRIGLNVRAIGENPGAADAAGINVSLYKYINIVLGGAICGLGGAYLAIDLSSWSGNFTSGKGWIAVALVIFASWKPLRAIWGSFLFGGLAIMGKIMQHSPIKISPYLLDLLPFLVTVIVLIVTSIRMSKENSEPKGLGVNYFREER